MKKLLFLFFAFGMMQLSAQNMSSSITANSTKEASSSSNKTMIELLAKDQVSNLSTILKLDKSQTDLVSALVVRNLKNKKFQSFFSDLNAEKLLGSGISKDLSSQVQSMLLSESIFQKGMGSVLNEDQQKKFTSYIPK